MRNWSDFSARNDGGAAIEYALVAALIAAVLLGSLEAVGSSLAQAYTVIGSAVAAVAGG